MTPGPCHVQATVPWAGDTQHYPGHKVMSHRHSLHRGITCAAHQIYYTLGKIVHKLMPLSNDEHCFSKPVIRGNLEFQSFRQSWTICEAVNVQNVHLQFCTLSSDANPRSL